MTFWNGQLRLPGRLPIFLKLRFSAPYIEKRYKLSMTIFTSFRINYSISCSCGASFSCTQLQCAFDKLAFYKRPSACSRPFYDNSAPRTRKTKTSNNPSRLSYNNLSSSSSCTTRRSWNNNVCPSLWWREKNCARHSFERHRRSSASSSQPIILVHMQN